MGKYDKEILKDPTNVGRMFQAFANELAEANRLKRIDQMRYWKAELGNPDTLPSEKMQAEQMLMELEDQA